MKSNWAGTSAPSAAIHAARPSVRMLRLHVSPAGQASIGGYKIGGEQLFFPNAHTP